MSAVDLREAWSDLLRRRPAFRESLALCGAILETWADWTPQRLHALDWSAAECRSRWERGVPLLAEAPVAVAPPEIEDLLGSIMELLVPVDESLAPGFQRLAEAWDRGTIGLAAFLPAKGRLGDGSAERESGLEPEWVGVLGCAALRPVLEAYFSPCREHGTEGVWMLGVCPFCGAPAGFADLGEGGQRRLACHLCGGAWSFARLRCPFCGVEGGKPMVRLDPGEREEGYAIVVCTDCRAYLKELDRRTRWNGGPPLVEDWGSPHFDLVAQRQGYWRAVPVPIQLARHS